MNSIAGKNQQFNYPFSNRESNLKHSIDNNIFISQYYREIMLPYSKGHRNTKNSTYTHDINNKLLIPSSQPTNILFQYTN